MAVQRDFVPAANDLGGDAGESLDLLADEEEGRPRLVAVEELQRGGRSLRVRAVVEGECDGVRPLDPAGNAEGTGEHPNVCRGGGQNPARNYAGSDE